MTTELLDPPNVISAMLDGATTVIRQTRFCWLVTENHDSNPAVRPMGPILEADQDLRVRFITDIRSHKAEEIWNNGRVQLLFSRESDGAFVVLVGEALVVTERNAVAAHWNRSFDQFFPTDKERSHAAFIEVRPRALKLWIRGVTPKHYGLRPALLTRWHASEWTEGHAHGLP